MKLKKIIIPVLTVLIVLAIAGLMIKNRVQSQVKELFSLNKTLQQEGYYMAEFEFKMMGILYDLDKGHYYKALSTLSRYHQQLKNRENLVRLPIFHNTEEEMNFYFDLQNPRSGAFMDDSFPFCTYNEPTENVILHLDQLAKSLAIPLRLKYRLSYLDSINTPEKLYAFLDDVSYVGWLGSLYPETSFLFARSLLSYWNNEGVIAKDALYHFSDAYKTALLKWFYTHQDSTSGYWGPLSRKDGKLQRIDLNNTTSVIKSFIDKNGNDLHPSFPLRYRDKIFATTLELLQKPLPVDNAAFEWHAWNISMRKGLKMLLRYLWKDASEENRKKAKTIIENFIRIQFEKYYIPGEGAFGNYPYAKHASLDGTGNFIYNDIGAWSPDKQKILWGNPDTLVKDLGSFDSPFLTHTMWDLIANHSGINTLRVYDKNPGYSNLTHSVFAVVYPNETKILDVMELVPGIITWLETTDLSMGNWTSREKLKITYATTDIKRPLIFKNTTSLNDINQILREKKELYIIGFDILQVPRCRITFRYSH